MSTHQNPTFKMTIPQWFKKAFNSLNFNGSQVQFDKFNQL